MDGRPLDVLEAALQSEVSVRLKDGEEYHGVLTGYDQHMNVVLSPPEGTEVSYDAFEDPPVEDTTVIRGDNVVSINA
jgi:small nuclear ribonucleoprotein